MISRNSLHDGILGIPSTSIGSRISRVGNASGYRGARQGGIDITESKNQDRRAQLDRVIVHAIATANALALSRAPSDSIAHENQKALAFAGILRGLELDPGEIALLGELGVDRGFLDVIRKERAVDTAA